MPHSVHIHRERDRSDRSNTAGLISLFSFQIVYIMATRDINKTNSWVQVGLPAPACGYHKHIICMVLLCVFSPALSFIKYKGTSAGRRSKVSLQTDAAAATHCVCPGRREAAGTACLCCAAACWASAVSFPAASELIPAPGSAQRVSPPDWSETATQANYQLFTSASRLINCCFDIL